MRFHRRQSRAFSLVEVLVVMAVIALLAALVAPSFASIFGARNLDSGTDSIAGLIEQARNEAVARKTYVWLGITPVQVDGGWALKVAMVGSKDGTGTNTSADNLLLLNRIVTIPNLSLTTWKSLKSSTQGLFTNAVPSSLSANSQGLIFTEGQTQFLGTTLTFTPQGEVLLKGAASSEDGFNDWIDVSLQQAHGLTVAANADDAAVLVEGATGSVKIVRLQ